MREDKSTTSPLAMDATSASMVSQVLLANLYHRSLKHPSHKLEPQALSPTKAKILKKSGALGCSNRVNACNLPQLQERRLARMSLHTRGIKIAQFSSGSGVPAFEAWALSLEHSSKQSASQLCYENMNQCLNS